MNAEPEVAKLKRVLAERGVKPAGIRPVSERFGEPGSLYTAATVPWQVFDDRGVALPPVICLSITQAHSLLRAYRLAIVEVQSDQED